jgi:hypothetical protein
MADIRLAAIVAALTLAAPGAAQNITTIKQESPPRMVPHSRSFL